MKDSHKLFHLFLLTIIIVWGILNIAQLNTLKDRLDRLEKTALLELDNSTIIRQTNSSWVSENHIVRKNKLLKVARRFAAKNYEYWWEAPECQEYREFHKEYEKWLVAR